MIDGVTVNEAWGASAGIGFGNMVSVDDIARIEFIRGPVSSVYGANAFFGIINIVTKGAADSPKAWARTSINSVNGSITAAGFAAGDPKQQIRGSIQIMDRIGDTTTVDGVGDPGMPLKGDESYSFSGSLAGSYNGTFAQVRAYSFRRDNPFAPYNGDPAAAQPYQEDNSQVLAEVGHTTQVNDSFTVTARTYGSIYQFFDHIVQYQMPAFEDYGDASTFGAEVRGRYDVIKNVLGITAGTEGDYSITQSHSYEVGTAGVTVPKDFNFEGVYAELDGQPTSWLGFTGGLRYDRNSVIDTRVSPRAALFISNPDKYGLKFLLHAQGFPQPERVRRRSFTTASTFGPADQLHSETIQSFEGVLWAKPVPGLSTRLSAFYWDAKGIVEELPDNDPRYAGRGLISFQNVGRIISEGFEGEMSYRNSAGWYGFAGGNYSRASAAPTPAATCRSARSSTRRPGRRRAVSRRRSCGTRSICRRSCSTSAIASRAPTSTAIRRPIRRRGTGSTSGAMPRASRGVRLHARRAGI